MANTITTAADSNGNAQLQDNEVVYSIFVDLTETSFHTPGALYTGYAADGSYYVNGVASTTPPTGFGQTASWAAESFATDLRGDSARFPDRILIINDFGGNVSILDADTLTVWMRIGGDNHHSLFKIGEGDSSHYDTSQGYTTDRKTISFSNGVLICKSREPTTRGIYIINFRDDIICFINDTDSMYREGISNRTSIDPTDSATWTESSVSATTKLLIDPMVLDISTGYIGTRPLLAVGHPNGFCGINLRGVTHTSGGRTNTLPLIKQHPFTIARNLSAGDFLISRVNPTNLLQKFFYLTEPNANPKWDWLSGSAQGFLGIPHKGDRIKIGSSTFTLDSVGSQANGLTIQSYSPVSPADLSTLNLQATYTVERAVPIVEVLNDGNLAVQCGGTLIRSVDQAWWDVGTNSINGFEDIGVRVSISGAEPQSSYDLVTEHYLNFRDFIVSGDVIYVLCEPVEDVGILILSGDIPTTTTTLVEGEYVELLYENASFGFTGNWWRSKAFAIDPESGNMFIATFGKDYTSALWKTDMVEISLATGTIVKSGIPYKYDAQNNWVGDTDYQIKHHATDYLRLCSIAGLRNPSGPPSQEVL